MFDELQAECSTTNFTQEEVKYYTDSFKKAFDTEETDPIKRAMNALQGVKDYQDAWRKYGSSSRVELYTSVTNEQEWLEEFSKNIE